MATRRMRIKAVINVPRGGPKQEPQDQPLPPPSPASTPVADILPTSPAATTAAVPSPRICSGPVSPMPPSPAMVAGEPPPVQNIPEAPPPGGDVNLGVTNLVLSPGPCRSATPPIDKVPSSPKSPASSWKLQRPSPSKSPAGLPPSGSIIRRSPSPALINARLTNSPGPSPGFSSPLSPVKSLVSSYTSPSLKSALQEALGGVSNRTPIMIIPTAPVTFGTRTIDSSFVYPTSVSPAQDMSIKSPTYFRPPPSPSPSHQDFHSVKSPPAGVMSRPSPAQSPVFGMSGLRTSSSFLSHHFNSNSNSADSHEVAALMSNSSNNSVPSGSLMVYPHSPDKSHRHSSGRDSATSRGSENSCPYPGGMGAFSSISNKDNICPSPSFSKTVLDNPDNLKRRLEERRKEAPNPTKFAQARRDFYEKVNNGQTPERSKLTMLHFTFYNPPKPGGSDSGRKGKSRSSRASSVCSEMENSNKEIIVDDKKAASAPSSIASRRTTASSIGSGIGSGGSVVSVHDDCQSEAGSTASNNSSNVPGPRVKVGPDGQLIIDEQSLVVETSESQRARKQIEDMEVVSGADYAVGSSGFYRYKRSYRRGHDWTEKETIRFYRALNQCGTDFSMMLSLFPNRSRQELKSKFKREDRKNPDMVSKALASCHFDPDEGISSDEDLALYYGKTKNVEDGGLTEKEKLLREEMEVEQVICSSEDPLQGKAKKKKKEKVEFTAAQKKEFNLTNFKGAGTGKGKKWNSPVVGLTGKLPPMPNPSSVPIPSTAGLTRFVSVKVEPAVKLPPKKRAPKKSKTAEKVNDGEATVPIIVAPGAIIAGSVVSDNTLPFVTVKKEKVDTIPNSGQDKVQPPLTDADSEPQKGKRRRLPKTKPNVKLEGVKRNRTSNETEIVEAEAAKSSSQTTKSSLVCDDLFRYDASDPLGLNVTPVPLPVVEETILEGNEEGREGLVMVDLDELNAVVREQASSSDTGSKQTEAKNQGQSSKRRRKSSSNTDGIAVTTARVVHGDPFGKSNMTTTVAAIKKEKDVGSGLAAANKKVKVLPYRVPGPGGNLADCRRSSLADELEIEIELNTPSTES